MKKLIVFTMLAAAAGCSKGHELQSVAIAAPPESIDEERDRMLASTQQHMDDLDARAVMAMSRVPGADDPDLQAARQRMVDAKQRLEEAIDGAKGSTDKTWAQARAAMKQAMAAYEQAFLAVAARAQALAPPQ